MSDLLNVTIADGKYTVVQDGAGKLLAFRYSRPWRDCCGDKLILALATELTAALDAKKLAEQRSKAAEKACAEMRDAWNKYDSNSSTFADADHCRKVHQDCKAGQDYVPKSSLAEAVKALKLCVRAIGWMSGDKPRLDASSQMLRDRGIEEMKQEALAAAEKMIADLQAKLDRASKGIFVTKESQQ